MKKITNEFFNESYYFHELDNGLKLYIIHKPDFNLTSAAFGTPFGALDIHENFNGKHYDFHPGIAHFLEHKVFEDDGRDIMDEFTKMGALVNAFTSYDETVYYFSLTGKKNVLECINLLMDFVQEFNIDEASVEKEKPIIAEELAMYEQMPDSRLLKATMKALYHNYPLKYDIGGDAETVFATTLQELKTCYDINYHPSNMALVITSNLDPELILETVINNQSAKNFKKIEVAKAENEAEPFEVKDKLVEFEMDVNSRKNVYAIKCDFSALDKMQRLKIETALSYAYRMIFTKRNEKYQSWIDEHLINDYFGFDCDFNQNASYILFYSENNTALELKQLIDDNLINPSLDEKVLETLKRCDIGAIFDGFNKPENYNTDFIRLILDDKGLYDRFYIIKDMTINDLYDALKCINYDNYSLISLLPKSAK